MANEATIKVLGSAAAEGIPALFCNCRVCQEAWKNKGKDVRMRASYLVNGSVRIDFGPDSMAQEYKYELHSENLRHLFITHPHIDHLLKEEFNWRMPGFSVVPEENILNVYGSPGTLMDIKSYFYNYRNFQGDYKKFRMNLVEMKRFETLELPDVDQAWTQFPADHMYERPAGEPSFYMIRIGKKYALIANDTGVFADSVWEYLEKNKVRFDLVITDCTGGILDIEHGHMSGKYVLETKEKLEKLGCITKDTPYYINHFSHNCKATHVELEAHFNPHGIQVCYDGLEIKF